MSDERWIIYLVLLAIVGISRLLFNALHKEPCTVCTTPTRNRSRLCDQCGLEQRQRQLREQQEAEKIRRQQELIRREQFAEHAQNRTYLFALSPMAFEEHVGQIFASMGFNVRVTPTSRDGGIDLFVEKDSGRSIVQCKHFTKGNVSRPDLQRFYGVLIHEGANRGYFVTTGRFTADAIAFVSGKPITLLDIEDLIELGSALPTSKPSLPAAKGTCAICGTPALRRACHGCLERFAALLARDIPPCVRCGANVRPSEERTNGLCPRCASPAAREKIEENEKRSRQR